MGEPKSILLPLKEYGLLRSKVAKGPKSILLALSSPVLLTLIKRLQFPSPFFYFNVICCLIIASLRPIFPFLINLTCLLYNRGQRPSLKGPNSQLQHSFIIALLLEGIFIDSITFDKCYIAVSFQELDVDRRPVESYVAIIIREAAFLPKEPNNPTKNNKIIKIQGIQVLV